MDLHDLGISLHMHQDEARMILGGQAQEPGIQAERADVVDDIGAVIKGGLSDLEFCRVHGDQGLGRFPQSGYHGDDASDLLFGGDGVGTGPGAFSADVDDVRAVGEKSQAVVDGLLGLLIEAAVIKRIGRDVDNAYDPGLAAETVCLVFDPEGVFFPHLLHFC